MVARRHMKAPIASLQAFLQRVRICDIAMHRFHIEACNSAEIRAGPKQRANRMPARRQFVYEIGTNESRTSGDKAFHAICTSGDLPKGFPRYSAREIASHGLI